MCSGCQVVQVTYQVRIITIGAGTRQIDGNLSVKPADFLERRHIQSGDTLALETIEQVRKSFPPLAALGLHGDHSTGDGCFNREAPNLGRTATDIISVIHL
jgi:hypothetical protein